MAFSLEKSKGKVSDIKKNIDDSKNKLSELEKTKSDLLDAQTDILGSDIDEATQSRIHELINNELERNSEKGKELAEIMNEDMSSLENIKTENQESLESNSQERSKLENKKKILEKIGMGGALEQGISELDDNRKDIEAFQDEITETQKEMNNISAKLNML